ncbi:hypothetical protein PoB_004163300 [Plakobranchus ocellatus]|uniref:Uncharacterized protein n=1 Tax=Plakobranchus ocellatus TaxID=259542 RepID=A0AAV4B693_9GAST|nr:hypothetical protein PoB_004163300 [Plakobranchus ocellatus]
MATMEEIVKKADLLGYRAAAEHISGPAAISAIKKNTRYPGRLSWTSASPTESQEKAISELTGAKKAKKRKKLRASDQEKACQEAEVEEGGPAYQAGMF